MNRVALRSAALALVVLAGALAGCTSDLVSSRDPADNARLQAADAYREAARRCGPAGVRQTEGSPGTTPSDYVCSGH